MSLGIVVPRAVEVVSAKLVDKERLDNGKEKASSYTDYLRKQRGKLTMIKKDREVIDIIDTLEH